MPACLVGSMTQNVFSASLLHETGGTGEGAGGSCLKLANKLCPKFVSIIRLQQAEIGKEYLLNDKQRNIYICNNIIKWFD